MISVALTATSTNPWTPVASAPDLTSALSAIEALGLARRALISRASVLVVTTHLVLIVMSRLVLVRSVCQVSILKALGVNRALDIASNVSQPPNAWSVMNAYQHSTSKRTNVSVWNRSNGMRTLLFQQILQ